MITDAEVTQLYRSLLGRDPENADTIAAFKGFYPTLERGRRAVFTSDEFEAYFARVTGRTLRARDPVASVLARILLERAASAAPAPPPSPPPDDAVRRGLLHIFSRNDAGAARFAVVVGAAPDVGLADLLPFDQAEAAILHIAPGFPPVVPVAGSLEAGTTVFRLDGDAASIAGILGQFGRRIDALCLLGRPASLAWVAALRPYLASRALLLVGRPHEGFDAAALSDAVAASHDAEPVQRWRGLHLHHLGGWLLPVSYDPPDPPAAPPDRAAHPALAIAAIVRDEAVCVENMLRSAQPVASFYAVLDTGSTDRTAALVQAFLGGCGVATAFAIRDHTAFGDDFAAMRNAALAMVPGWVEWVLMLDADEELAPEDHAALLALIVGATHEAYALPRYNFPGVDKQGVMLSYPDRQVRLLRHTPDGRVAYSGVVHETVRGVAIGRPPLDAAIMGGGRGGPHIHHLVRRFRTREQEDRKQAFYRDILHRQPDKTAGPS